MVNRGAPERGGQTPLQRAFGESVGARVGHDLQRLIGSEIDSRLDPERLELCVRLPSIRDFLYKSYISYGEDSSL